MKPAPKITRNLIFGLCLLTGLMAAVIYAETRQVAVKPTETILEPATVQNQATPTPVAVFKGTSNDYTPAERKAMIEAQTKARKQEEADAKAIANGTYKEPKPDATLIKQREKDLKEREKYEAEEAKSEIASQEYEKRLREEDPALAALQDELTRKGDIMIAEYDRYIQAKMDAGFSREDAVRIWKHDQNK
jgi:hypothetical protein